MGTCSFKKSIAIFTVWHKATVLSALKNFGSINSLGCQLDVQTAGVQMQNELGQLVKVTDILYGQRTHTLSEGAKTLSFIKWLWSLQDSDKICMN